MYSRHLAPAPHVSVMTEMKLKILIKSINPILLAVDLFDGLQINNKSGQKVISHDKIHINDRD